MFGAGMPILFPIGLASFLIFYVVERLSLAYSSQKPPMFDHHLNRLAISTLLLAPILFCCFGYWMLTNVQNFSNDVIYTRTFNAHIITGHKFPIGIQHLVNQGLPLFLGSLLFFGLYFIRVPFSRALLRRGVGTELAEILDEKTKTEKHPIYQTLVAQKRRKIIRHEK